MRRKVALFLFTGRTYEYWCIWRGQKCACIPSLAMCWLCMCSRSKPAKPFCPPMSTEPPQATPEKLQILSSCRPIVTPLSPPCSLLLRWRLHTWLMAGFVTRSTLLWPSPHTSSFGIQGSRTFCFMSRPTSRSICKIIGQVFNSKLAYLRFNLTLGRHEGCRHEYFVSLAAASFDDRALRGSSTPKHRLTRPL